MRRIASLDGLRALSIVLVLFGHAINPRYNRHLASGAEHSARLGVNVFFVISGFLITAILAEELRKTGAINFRQFYIKRAWRLMPAFYAYLLFLLIMTLFHRVSLHPKDFAFSLAYITNYSIKGGPWEIGHFWSLSVEEQFYFLWPVAFLLAGIRRAPRTLTIILFLAPAVRLLLLPWRSSLGPVYRTMFPCICDALAIGCMLALVQERLHQNATYLKFLRSGFYVLLIPAAVALELVTPTAFSVVICPTLTNIAIVILLDGCMTFDTSWIGSLLNSRLLVTIGVMSYSIYLWQQPFLHHHYRALWTRFPLNLGLALSLAALSYFFIEKPLLAFGRRLLRNDRPLDEPVRLAA